MRSTSFWLEEMMGEQTGQSLRVFVIEDDRDALTGTLRMLRLLGHWAAGVSSAEAALDRFFEGAFDVLLVDMNLPGLSGLDVARRLSAREHLPVIFASGAMPPADGTEGALWLSKPYTIEQLRAALASCRDVPRS
ncbi:MAG: response regulator [Variovorax sp.]|nr:response regulator [Variovorax sp.]